MLQIVFWLLKILPLKTFVLNPSLIPGTAYDPISPIKSVSWAQSQG